MSGFQVMVRIGSNNVSAPLRGRRLPAIFPKRCKAGGQAGSSWRGLPGAVAWGRAVPVAGPPGVHISYLSAMASQAGLRHEAMVGLGCYLHLAPNGAWAVVWNCKTEKCKM